MGQGRKTGPGPGTEGAAPETEAVPETGLVQEIVIGVGETGEEGAVALPAGPRSHAQSLPQGVPPGAREGTGGQVGRGNGGRVSGARLQETTGPLPGDRTRAGTQGRSRLRRKGVYVRQNMQPNHFD